MAKKLTLSNGEIVYYDANSAPAIKTLHKRILALELELEQLAKRKNGMSSGGVEDRYTPMQAEQLRHLIIKRGGNPDEIVEGLHSRQRAIAMREWLRTHGGKTKSKDEATNRASKRRLSNREIEAIATGPKPKRKVSSQAREKAKVLTTPRHAKRAKRIV